MADPWIAWSALLHSYDKATRITHRTPDRMKPLQGQQGKGRYLEEGRTNYANCLLGEAYAELHL